MITRTRILLITVLILPISPTARTQSLSKERKDILSMQDSRSLGGGRLLSYLQSRDARTRYGAAIAFANLQDTSTISSLVPLLEDQDVQVRTAAAFALGEIGTTPATKALMSALTPDQDIQVLARIFEALGKCGDADALNAVVAYIPSAKTIAVKSDQALSIGQFGLRRITSERGVWLCFDLLKDNHSVTRSTALYALWRCVTLGVVDEEFSNRAYIIVKLMSDLDVDVRINLAALLGRTKSGEAPRLITMFEQMESRSPDWRVQVQLARSSGLLSGSDPHLLGILLSYLNDQNDHVKITSLTTLATLDSTTVITSGYRDRLLLAIQQLAVKSSKAAPSIQGEAIVAMGRLFPRELSRIRESFEHKKLDNILQAKYIEALSFYPTRENLDFILDQLTNDSVRVAMAAWDVLKRMLRIEVMPPMRLDSSFADSLPSILVEKAERGLQRNSVAITTLVADFVADSSFIAACERTGSTKAIAHNLHTAFSKLSSENDAEAMLAMQNTLVKLRDSTAVPLLVKTLADPNRTVAQGAANALRRITGQNFKVAFPQAMSATPTESDWKLLESISPGQRISIKTTKGTFTIRLRKEDAPFTVLAFVKLVRKKFYNGLTFHRVVPDFVIQGGDPRGDGWGGPGFTIRSEFSLAKFGRGSVGMASSGKDTEGCQFFITHVPTPHLDGRYTLFATVSSGMDVVDRIQVGDRILGAEVR